MATRKPRAKKTASTRTNPTTETLHVARDERGRFMSTGETKMRKAVRSAVGFYREFVKRPDVHRIMEKLSQL